MPQQEQQVIDVEGKTYLVYFRYWPAQHNYPTEPDTSEEIEIETVYQLLQHEHPKLDQKIKQALLTMKRENEDATSSKPEG